MDGPCSQLGFVSFFRKYWLRLSLMIISFPVVMYFMIYFLWESVSMYKLTTLVDIKDQLIKSILVQLIVVIFLVLFTPWCIWKMYREANRNWQKLGHPLCANCGYDLVGLTDPRCPECGTPFDPRLLQLTPPSAVESTNDP